MNLPQTICVKCENYQDRGPFIKICSHYKRSIADAIVIECDYFIKKEGAQ